MARYLQMKTGAVACTGAIVNVKLQFKPKFVQLYDYTVGNLIGTSMFPLPNDKAFQTYTSGSHATDLSVVASDGITIGPDGFSIGTNFASNGHTVYWVAIG